MIADTAESQKRKSDPVLLQLLGSGEPCSMALSHCVPKAGVRPEPVPIGFETGRRRKTVGQITLVFAILSFQGHVWDTVGQRDSGTKMETAAFSDGLMPNLTEDQSSIDVTLDISTDPKTSPSHNFQNGIRCI